MNSLNQILHTSEQAQAIAVHKKQVFNGKKNKNIKKKKKMLKLESDKRNWVAVLKISCGKILKKIN